MDMTLSLGSCQEKVCWVFSDLEFFALGIESCLSIRFFFIYFLFICVVYSMSLRQQLKEPGPEPIALQHFFNTNRHVFEVLAKLNHKNG